MAFFKKLKDRMFKSASKIDEGLEAIVSDGGEADAAAAQEAERAQAAARQRRLNDKQPSKPKPRKQRR